MFEREVGQVHLVVGSYQGLFVAGQGGLHFVEVAQGIFTGLVERFQAFHLHLGQFVLGLGYLLVLEGGQDGNIGADHVQGYVVEDLFAIVTLRGVFQPGPAKVVEVFQAVEQVELCAYAQAHGLLFAVGTLVGVGVEGETFAEIVVGRETRRGQECADGVCLVHFGQLGVHLCLVDADVVFDGVLYALFHRGRAGKFPGGGLCPKGGCRDQNRQEGECFFRV